MIIIFVIFSMFFKKEHDRLHFNNAGETELPRRFGIVSKRFL